jgi:hypothetical protein
VFVCGRVHVLDICAAVAASMSAPRDVHWSDRTADTDAAAAAALNSVQVYNLVDDEPAPRSEVSISNRDS